MNGNILKKGLQLYCCTSTDDMQSQKKAPAIRCFLLIYTYYLRLALWQNYTRPKAKNAIF